MFPLNSNKWVLIVGHPASTSQNKVRSSIVGKVIPVLSDAAVVSMSQHLCDLMFYCHLVVKLLNTTHVHKETKTKDVTACYKV